MAERVGEFLRGGSDKDLFWSINGVGAPELGVVYVPAGCKVGSPVGLRCFAAEGGDAGEERMPVSNPRVVVVVEDGGELEIVEEFWGSGGDRCYWANAVLDVVVGERAKLRHCYVQRQSLNAAHIKWTSVRQVSPVLCYSILVLFFLVFCLMSLCRETFNAPCKLIVSLCVSIRE